MAQNWTSRTLRVNPEYQRGLVWTPVQKQRLVDSVFRGYPLPSFYFRVTTHKGPDGNPTQVWEIVDGQQRIEALAGYLRDEWPALAKDDPKLSLPDAIRQVESPWAGKLFSQLSSNVKESFKDAKIQGLVITSVNSEDEVRDLFIRLQAGTALSRQQIRDAWPGPIGPFVESLAGRGTRRPSFELFSWIDRRGTRRTEELDEAEDEYVSDRQTCAQLLTLYFARERTPDSMPALATRSLDDMYHQNTSFDQNGEKARQFKELLGWCDRIILSKSEVIRKNRLFSLFTFLDDLSRNSTVRINDDLMTRINHEFWSNNDEDEPRGGRVISSTTLTCLLYTSPSPRDLSTSRMPSSA